jgi:hypothetical protein
MAGCRVSGAAECNRPAKRGKRINCFSRSIRLVGYSGHKRAAHKRILDYYNTVGHKMNVNDSGGGFFSKPFADMNLYGPYSVFSGINGAMGGWAHSMFFPLATVVQGRWIQIIYSRTDASLNKRSGNLQIGIGAAGAETLFLPGKIPSPTSGFYYEIDTVAPSDPQSIEFPFQIPINVEFSVRASSNTAVQTFLGVYIYVWG